MNPGPPQLRTTPGADFTSGSPGTRTTHGCDVRAGRRRLDRKRGPTPVTSGAPSRTPYQQRACAWASPRPQLLSLEFAAPASRETWSREAGLGGCGIRECGARGRGGGKGTGASSDRKGRGLTHVWPPCQHRMYAPRGAAIREPWPPPHPLATPAADTPTWTSTSLVRLSLDLVRLSPDLVRLSPDTVNSRAIRTTPRLLPLRVDASRAVPAHLDGR